MCNLFLTLSPYPCSYIISDLTFEVYFDKMKYLTNQTWRFKNSDMKDLENPITLARLEAPVRAELINEIKDSKQKKIVIKSLIEAAMQSGLLDPIEVRNWLGLGDYSLALISRGITEIKDKWLKETDVEKDARITRVGLIKKLWSNIQECEAIYRDAKSTGDKVKAKQLELQYIQYLGKLNFLEAPESPGSGTQVNVVAWSGNKEEKK